MLSNVLSFSADFLHAYEGVCQPVCREFQISQTAFDIVMFLANNPEYTTASDIVHLRGIRANLVSVNVDRLAESGYLLRCRSQSDRRKVSLQLTPAAQPIIQKGRAAQEEFYHLLTQGIDPDTLQRGHELFCQLRDHARLIAQRS